MFHQLPELMSKNKSGKSRSILIEIKIRKRPYKIYWNEWVWTADCFLTTRQLRVLESYETHGGLKPIMEETGLSYNYWQSELKMARTKLKVRLPEFEKWKQKKRYK